MGFKNFTVNYTLIHLSTTKKKKKNTAESKLEKNKAVYTLTWLMLFFLILQLVLFFLIFHLSCSLFITALGLFPRFYAMSILIPASIDICIWGRTDIFSCWVSVTWLYITLSPTIFLQISCIFKSVCVLYFQHPLICWWTSELVPFSCCYSR